MQLLQPQIPHLLENRSQKDGIFFWPSDGPCVPSKLQTQSRTQQAGEPEKCSSQVSLGEPRRVEDSRYRAEDQQQHPEQDGKNKGLGIGWVWVHILGLH